MTKIVGFLPQILAVAVLAAISWAVASVLRVVVANLLGPSRSTRSWATRRATR